MALRSSNQKDGIIRCIFFSEFHHEAGRKITYQVPKGFLSKEVFDAVSAYIIPKKMILEKVVTILSNTLGYKITGYPVTIRKEKYKRGELRFNLCLVSDSGSRTLQYEPIVMKLSHYLMNLEHEMEFLSDEKKKSQLSDILQHILQQLNSQQFAVIQLDEVNTLYLKIIRMAPSPPPVHKHDVPIFLESKDSFRLEQWDLTTRLIIPYINGQLPVFTISKLAQVDIELVKLCIQNLILVTLLPIFSNFNVYIVTSEIHKLVQSQKLQQKCLSTVSLGDKLPLFRSVFQIYCSMQAGTSVKDICNRFNPNKLEIDIRKLVQFGLMHNFLQRRYEYPISSDSQSEFDGTKNVDEICCLQEINPVTFLEHLENESQIMIYSC